MAWLPIAYREFWDVPRMFVVEGRGEWLLFDCAFDEASDEYGEDYVVYALAAPPPASGPWTALPSSGVARGRIAVKDVAFDPTLRKQVSSDSIAALLGGSAGGG